MKRFLILVILYANPAMAEIQFPERFYCIGNDTQAMTLRLQVAETREQQRHGLMFRRSIKPYDGMLFAFDGSRPITMWMKNTYIPLDMLFLDKNGTIVQIIENTVPMSEAIISSDKPVTTVIELEAGRAAKEGFKTQLRVVEGTCPARSAGDKQSR